MQAILCKYQGPTNNRGSRIRAHCDAGTISVGYDAALSLEQNYDVVAMRLARELGWISTPDNLYANRWHKGNIDGHMVYVMHQDDCVGPIMKGD